MVETTKKPAIRFAGFTEAWEQRKLGEIADKVTEKNTQNQYSETFTNSAEFGVINQRDFFEHDISNANNIGGYYVVKKEDFVYNPRISVTAPCGPINCNRLDRNGVISPLYTVFRTHNIDTVYLEWYFKSHYWHSYMFFNGDTGARADRFSIKSDLFFQMPIPLPSVPEQRKIGSIFTQLDNLITLHQRKCDKLKNIKKACLEKMFPKNGSNVPEIRFKGFTEAWEQRKFSEVFSILQNNTLSRAELDSENGYAKNVHYGDVLIKFGEYLDVQKENLPYIKSTTLVRKYKASFLQDGDIIIADTAEDEAVGKSCETANSQGQTLISGLHTIPSRPYQKFASGYLGYYMNSNAYHNQLLPLMQGIKVTSVSKSSLADTKIVYPKSEKEQRSIASFFIALDNLITLHQRKLFFGSI